MSLSRIAALFIMCSIVLSVVGTSASAQNSCIGTELSNQASYPAG
jgi:hypothetical protein